MIAETYNYYFKHLSDPRTYNLPLISNPWGLINIIFVYLLIIKLFLPNYMHGRAAHQLKKTIAIYNIFQIIACSILIHAMIEATSTPYTTLRCLEMDQSESKQAMRMTKLFWWTFILKTIELLETCLFILRKKFNQVTLLHIYHHVATLTFSWVATKYYPEDIIAFYVILNSGVHVIMYSYYLLSSLGPNMQKRLQPWKARLTLVQMIQFGIVIVYSSQGLRPSCPSSSKNIIWSFLIYITIMFFMFLAFYRRNYVLKKRK